MPLSSSRARLIGEKGRRRRWSSQTQEQRNAFMERVRAGQEAKYLERARATEGGDQLSDRDLAFRALQLRLADMADYRIKAWDALQARKAAS